MNNANCFRRCVAGTKSLTPYYAFLLGLFPLFASAAPSPLGCQVNQTDPVSLKISQSMIENTSGKAIAQGTVVEITVQIVPGVGKVKSVTSRVPASSTLQKHDTMSGGDTPPNARSCTAKIALVQPKTTITNKAPPAIAK